MSDKKRIVSATVHPETNEVEIVVEVEVEADDLFHEKYRLFTWWVDVSEVILHGKEWNEVNKN